MESTAVKCHGLVLAAQADVMNQSNMERPDDVPSTKPDIGCHWAKYCICCLNSDVGLPHREYQTEKWRAKQFYITFAGLKDAFHKYVQTIPP